MVRSALADIVETADEIRPVTALSGGLTVFVGAVEFGDARS